MRKFTLNHLVANFYFTLTPILFAESIAKAYNSTFVLIFVKLHIN